MRVERVWEIKRFMFTGHIDTSSSTFPGEWLKCEFRWFLNECGVPYTAVECWNSINREKVFGSSHNATKVWPELVSTRIFSIFRCFGVWTILPIRLILFVLQMHAICFQYSFSGAGSEQLAKRNLHMTRRCEWNRKPNGIEQWSAQRKCTNNNFQWFPRFVRIEMNFWSFDRMTVKWKTRRYKQCMEWIQWRCCHIPRHKQQIHMNEFVVTFCFAGVNEWADVWYLIYDIHFCVTHRWISSSSTHPYIVFQTVHRYRQKCAPKNFVFSILCHQMMLV